MKKFVELWGGQENPEGFIDFMYKNILPACFMAPLKSHFDITDAQTVLALNEIGNCLLAIRDRRVSEIFWLKISLLPRSVNCNNFHFVSSEGGTDCIPANALFTYA